MQHTELKLFGIPRAFLAILCGALFYCYQFVLRVSPNIMQEDLLRDFSISASALGVTIGFYSWSYAGIQIPLGIALDRYGPGKMLALASLICGVSCFLFASSNSTVVASLSLFLMGLGSAGGFLGSIKLGTTWFSPKHLAKVIAVVMIFGTLGAAVGGTPLRVLIELYGWKTTMHLLGGVGMLLSLCIYGVVGRIQVPLLYEPSSNIFSGLTTVARSPQAWLISIYSMLMYAPITIMGTAWGGPFLKSAYQIHETLAVTFITVMFMGAAIGSPVFCVISDKLNSRNIPMMMGAVLSAVLYLMIIFISGLPLWFLYILFFAAGFAYTAKSLSFACICEIMPQSSSAVSVGFINTIVMAAGAVLHPLMGKILVWNWDGVLLEGIQVYSEWDYRTALSIIPFCLVISVIVLRYVRETHHAAELTQANKGAMYLSDVE